MTHTNPEMTDCLPACWADCLPACWADGGPDPDPETWVHHAGGCPNGLAAKLAERMYVPLMKRWGYEDDIIASESTRQAQMKSLLIHAKACLEVLAQVLPVPEHEHHGFPAHVTQSGKGIWDKSCSQCLAALHESTRPKPVVIDGPWVIDQICQLELPDHEKERLKRWTHFLVQLCNTALNTPTRTPMEYTLDDYKNAPSGVGPLAAEWNDKPHRLIYDLVARLRRKQ